MNTMTTVSEVLNDLKSKGYTVDFNLDDNCLICHSNSLKVHPGDFVVDRHFRFEGMSDPSDEAIVYAISSPKHDIKGTLVNGYGISSDKMTDDLIKALGETAPVKHLKQRPDVTPTKSTDVTPPKPEAEREAQMVTMDLNLLKTQIKQEASYQDGDRSAMTIFKSEGMRIVLIALHKGAEMKTHTAPGTISVQVLEGHITFTTEQKTADRGAGQMLALHAGIPHKVFANEESIFLLTISIMKGSN
jgi:quercetin dioxygenase-like cupin family protein